MAFYLCYLSSRRGPDSSLLPELISLFNRNQFKPQPQLPSHPLSDISRDNLLDQSFSNPNSPWYIPRGTDPLLDPDRLYAKSLIKDLVSLIPQDVPFDQIQAPSGLAFNPTSPIIHPDICSDPDLFLDQLEEFAHLPFGPQSNPMGYITAADLRSSLSFKLTNDPKTSLWELHNWCSFASLDFETFLDILRTIDKDKYLMPEH